jgi:hypothetical protein
VAQTVIHCAAGQARLVVLAIFVAILALSPWSKGAASAERFVKLSGLEIRAKLAGMEITDEIHFSDVFNRDGTLTSHAMSRKSLGTWRVVKDDLCLDRAPEPGSGCVEVWLAGNKIQLKKNGSGLPFEGILKRPGRASEFTDQRLE